MNNLSVIPSERIEHSIFFIRGQKVIMDHDLAVIYGVTTARLNQQVQRNQKRFPIDFAFVLTSKEFADLMLQNATSSSHWGGRRKLPRAFTEHGAIMAASVLSTPTAITASIHVVRVFVRLREILATHKDLAQQLQELEDKFVDHDKKLAQVFDAIRKLMYPLVPRNKGWIGFKLDE